MVPVTLWEACAFGLNVGLRSFRKLRWQHAIAGPRAAGRLRCQGNDVPIMLIWTLFWEDERSEFICPRAKSLRSSGFGITEGVGYQD